MTVKDSRVPTGFKVTTSLTRCIMEGMWRFTVISLGGFSVWAFAGRWFYPHFGEGGLYAVTTVVFLGLAVLLLNPLVSGPRRVWRLSRAFVPAFVAYAIAWCLLWCALGAGLGEWLGSLAGSLAFVAVISWGFASWGSFASSTIVFFLTHSMGNFAGGWLMVWVLQPHGAGVLAGAPKDFIGILAKLAWGLAYGVGFGAGLGYTLHASHHHSESPESSLERAELV
jgi:hypothetical protein